MEILFDLQSYLENTETNTEFKDEVLQPYGALPPTLIVLEHDGVKFISVSGREHKSSGLMLQLSGLPKINLGYRIVITGRIDKAAPKDGWGIALTERWQDERAQLDQALYPNGIYSLTYLFSEENYRDTLFIYTTSWKDYLPKMDFTIDSILISNFIAPKEAPQDKRSVIYSMENHATVQNAEDGQLLSEHLDFLRRSGYPSIFAKTIDGKRLILLENRQKDYDGLDICLQQMGLMPNNEYTIKAFCSVYGQVDEGAEITFQTLPGFSWRNTQSIPSSGGNFELVYTISKHEANKLTDVRLTTNLAGARATILVHGIEITVGGA